MPADDEPDTSLRDRMRAALKLAMRTRDGNAMGALRSALAAIDNAEAIDPGPAQAGAIESAGALGSAEARRRDLSEADIANVVRAEISERLSAAEEYKQLGSSGRSSQLHAEAEVLAALL